MKKWSIDDETISDLKTGEKRKMTKEEKNKILSGFAVMNEDLGRMSEEMASMFDKLQTPFKMKNRGNVVLTRLNDEDLALVDILVGTGLYGSRSEAAAFLVHEALLAKKDILQKLAEKLQKIQKIKDEAKDILTGTN